MAEAVHQRVLRRIDKLIDPAGLEAGRADRCGAADGTTACSSACVSPPTPASMADETPFVGRNDLWRDRTDSAAGSALHHACPASGGIGMRRDPAAEREAGHTRRIGDVLDADASGDRPAVVGGHRHIEHHAAVAWQHVALPGQPGDGVAAAHEEAVAGMRQGDRAVAVLRVVEELQRAFVAAIAVVVEHASIAALRFARLQDHEVGSEMHQTARIDRAPCRGRPLVACAAARGSTAKCARPVRRS